MGCAPSKSPSLNPVAPSPRDSSDLDTCSSFLSSQKSSSCTPEMAVHGSAFQQTAFLSVPRNDHHDCPLLPSLTLDPERRQLTVREPRETHTQEVLKYRMK
ncbi:hypothetical protein SKAU_G00226900 [Synaphobranchus kaupii]|uniref:Uncharacterized protein n=1 Tax=Synaphobranchus kaupii TaxID=118154 RepID=A0A9Q1F4U8_SYNKA|nr:hypothetical protein SKAU_G00226900 [Synaphobranchus kaupii]